MELAIMGHKVNSVQLINNLKGRSVQLEFAYGYSINPVEKRKKGEVETQIKVVINSGDGKDKPEESDLFIGLDMGALFSVDGDCEEEKLEKETLRLFFPIIQAYVVQLTTLSNMTPLYVPPMQKPDEAGDDKKQTEKSKPKQRRKT
jgi:predicted small lipoprotein YifL